MARVPDAELDRLRREVSLERLATARGIVLKPSGSNLMGLCPFHDDHEPSLSLDPGQNLWHCFGCQRGRGVIDWVMKSEGISFRHAVELLRSQGTGDRLQRTDPPALTPPTTNARMVKHSRVPKLAVPLPADADAQHWAQVVMEEYHATLKDLAPEGKAYLAKRGLLNLMGNPPALLEDSQSLTVAGVGTSLRSVNRSQGHGKETDHERVPELRRLVALQELHLVQCRRFDTLEGIDDTHIEELWLDYLPRICSIAPLTKLSTLRKLEIGSCKQIADLERIAKIPSLETLWIMTGREIPSLVFLRGMANLCDFRTFGTKIVDGNLGILLELPKLERVVIHRHMRHYSHTEEQLNALLQTRRQTNVHRE